MSGAASGDVSSGDAKKGHAKGHRATAVALLAALTLAPEAQAQKKNGKAKKAKVQAQQTAGFSTWERQVIVPARVGFEISIFGNRIVLLGASGEVVDILEGVFD